MLPGMTPSQRAAVESQLGRRAPANKYGVATVDKRTSNGIRFDSKAEMVRHGELEMLHDRGAIRGFQRQVTFRLGCDENRYRVDFVVWSNDGKSWAEDVKGVETSKFRHDMKLWRSYGPCPLHIRKRGKEPIVVHGGYAK